MIYIESKNSKTNGTLKFQSIFKGNNNWQIDSYPNILHYEFPFLYGLVHDLNIEEDIRDALCSG